MFDEQLTVGEMIGMLQKLDPEMPVFTYVRSEMVEVTDANLTISTCYTEDDAEIDCLLIRV